MKINIIEKNGVSCAMIENTEKVITNVQSAIDLIVSADYEVGTKNIIIDKKLVNEDFFVLSTGFAGEVLQKFINYGGRIAVYGDFSHYTSKPLKDFMYESNKGKDIFFADSKDEAVDMMTR